MAIRKAGTRKIIAVLAIVMLLVSSSIALAQTDDDDGLDLTGQQQEQFDGSDDGDGGDGTEGDGTEGDGTEGDGTEGDGTEGDGTEGDGTKGDGTEGEGTEGDGTEGDGTDGDGTEGDGTEGDDEEGDDEEGDDFGGISLFSTFDFGTLAQGDPSIEIKVTKVNDEAVSSGDTIEVLVGENVTIEYIVTNTGDTNLQNVVVSDNVSSGNIYEQNNLNTGNPSFTETITYNEIDEDFPSVSGRYDINVEGKEPGKNGEEVDDDDYIMFTVLSPGIDIVLEAEETSVVAGETITYNYSIENTGDMELTDITVTLDNGDDSDNVASLAVGASKSGTLTYTTVEGDIGTFSNTATVIAYYTASDFVEETSDVVEVTVTEPEPEHTYDLDIEHKDHIRYWAKFEGFDPEFEYKEDGINKRIFVFDGSGLDDYDESGIADWSGVPIDIIAKASTVESEVLTIESVGETVTFRAVHSPGQSGKTHISEYDIKLIGFSNQKWTFEVTAKTGGDITGSPALSNFKFSACEEEPPVEPANPNIKITKTVDKKVVRAGSEITYTYKVKNTGDVPLTNVQITDKIYYLISEIDVQPVINLEFPGEDGTLEPGETATGTYTYTPQKAGTLTNVAKATGDYEDITVQDTDIVLVVVLLELLEAGIEINKTADPGEAKTGDTITYTYEVINTGEANIYIEKVYDDKLGNIFKPILPRLLKSGQSTEFTKEYVVTGQEGLDESGFLVNTATVTGKWFKGIVLKKITAQDEAEVKIIQTGSIKVIKTMSDDSDPEGITFILDKYEQGPAPRLLVVEEDSWPKTGVTDENGEILFDNLEPGLYTLAEIVPDGYETDLDPDEQIEVKAGETETVEVHNTKEEDEPEAGIRVVKTLDERGGEPHVGVEFKLYRHLWEPQTRVLALDTDDDWPRTGTTDGKGEILFEDLECEGYYYTLEEIGMDDYEVKYLGPDLEEYDECPDIYVDCEDITTIYVVNTEKEIRRPSYSPSRRTTTSEPVEVLEEPVVQTPPEEEPVVEEPVVVDEEPMVVAPKLGDLPFTGGNPAVFVFMGAALAGLGLYVRKRR